MKGARTSISGWGRHPWADANVRASEDLERAGEGASLSRGLGRAYGDAALPASDDARPLVCTPLADRILSFDEATGELRAEAGFTIGELARVFLPRGWFAPVSPGTQHVTLGGAVAADIHGKNHHVAGCFGEHVVSLRMRTGAGELLEVSRENHPELFFATLGGMGLTGHILEVSVRLQRVPSAWVYEESERLPNLEALIEALGESSRSWPLTVAWMDTSARGASAGRGIVMRGRWATADEAPAAAPKTGPSVRIPIDLPSGLVNPFTIGILNRLWYWKHGGRKRSRFVSPQSFWWILDSVHEWNRVFGRRGFTQYQCVLPSSPAIYRDFLALFQARRACSFVTVFKDCGEQGPGLLSFPQRGTSLAVDIPIVDARRTEETIAAFNEFVLAHGGRIYLAKDAFTRPEAFRAMYPRLSEWEEVRKKYDPDGRISSAQSMRLLGR